MKKFKNALLSVLAIAIATALFSCGGSSGKKSADSTAGTSTDTSKKASISAGFSPFDIVDITHNVKDYAKWRPVFDADSANQKAAGLQLVAVGRDADSSNRILIAFKISDMAKAKAMEADPKLKETMTKAGVISKPDFEYYHIIRFTPGEVKQWLVVNHKVKDFATWLKAFDAEGSAKRASEGLSDRTLGRSITDSNMVHVVFKITDLAKAKAAIFSDDKKKLMESAGVIGKPDIRIYNAQ